ncbi:hypothetical protein D3C79_899480 [compost metagenome]
MIDSVHHAHQRFAVRVRFIVIKQIKLGHTLAEKIAQNNARFHIAVPVDPDAIERIHGRADDVPGVIRGGQQLTHGLVAIELFVKRMGTGANKHANLATVLAFSAEFFCGTNRIITDRLTHVGISGNTPCKRT